MARAIGKARSWFWWVAGFLCALVFGRGAGADDFQAEYGIRIRPDPRPPVPRQAFGENEKRKVNELADAFLAAHEEPADPSPQEDEKIRKLVAGLGSRDYADRERATQGLVAIGRAALARLRKACESDDPEVAQRARDAVEKIESARERIAEELRGMGPGALFLLRERAGAQQKIAKETAEAATQADREGKKEEACSLREKAALAERRALSLIQLCVRLESDSGRNESMYGVREPLHGVREPLR